MKNKLLLLTITFIILSSFTNAGLIDNQEYYYKCDGNFSDAANNNDAIINGATPILNGKINEAYSYLINDNVGVPALGATYDDFTVNMWFNADNFASAQGLWGRSITPQFNFYLTSDTIITGNTPAGNIAWTFPSMSTGTWYMATLTRISDVWRMYINGNESVTGGFTRAGLMPNEIFYIGSRAGGNFFNGDIDEIAFWSRGLSDTEIIKLFNNNQALQWPYVLDGIFFENLSLINNSYINNELTIYYNVTTSGITNNINCSTLINGVINQTTINATQNTTLSFIQPFYSEDTYNIGLTCTDGINYTTTTSNYTYTYDVTKPTTTLSFIGASQGFNSTVSANLTCSDNVSSILNYNISLNNVLINNSNLTNGTQLNTTFSLVDGVNTLYGKCTDQAGNTNLDFKTYTAYIKSVNIIDEKTGLPFDFSNVTELKAYFEEFNTSYDFKGAGNTSVTIVSNQSENMRVEIVYDNQEVISRYISLGVIDNETNICANTDDITHYEQIILSGIEKGVLLKSLFADCYVAAGYTNIAYQDSLILPAYTTDRLYYLYTYDNQKKIYLASVDGSFTTYINLDTLEFSKTAYNFNILTDSISFENLDNQTLKIYYRNPKNDNTQTQVDIYRMDTDTLIFNTIDIEQPNDIIIYFDYSTLSGVNETTLFKIEVTKTTPVGTSTIKKYFNTNGDTGIIPNALGITIAILITIFGLSFNVSRLAFSWFGIFIVLASIFILALCLSTWVVNLIMFLDIIILVFIFIIMTKENYLEVA